MEKGTIPTLDLEVFKEHPHLVDYVDDDFVIAKNFTAIIQHEWTVRMSFLLMIECLEGQMQIEINGRPFTLKSGEAAICMPTCIVSQVMVSPYNSVRLIGFSTTFLRGLVKAEREIEQLFAYLYRNPVQHAKEHPEQILHYHRLLAHKIAQPQTKYSRQTMHHLISAIFCESIEFAMQHVERDAQLKGDMESSTQLTGMRRANLVFKQFMEELSQDNGLHRSVSYFANRLCYSPKYLSSVVRQVSGRTALDWINEYAIEQIKHQLKFSALSIKEIAEELNFSNQSFFGKYVKAHLGVSPAKYRESGGEH